MFHITVLMSFFHWLNTINRFYSTVNEAISTVNEAISTVNEAIIGEYVHV